MQIKKDRVKATIDSAARELFATRGFLETGISDIARGAGISVGNVYRYYGSKEELFYSLVPPEMVKKTKSLLRLKIRAAFGIPVGEAGKAREVSLRQEEFVRFLAENRLSMLAAFRHGKGTSYEPCPGELKSLILRSVGSYLGSLRGRGKHGMSSGMRGILGLVYDQLFSGTLAILERYPDPGDLFRMMGLLMDYHFGGLERLFAR